MKETNNRYIIEKICNKGENERGKLRGTKTNGSYNITLQTSYKVGYILIELGQIPYMLFIEIT